MASSAPNGSSISMILGSCTSARQIEARCCMPPDNCQGSFFSKPSRPTSFNSAFGARQIFVARQPLHVDRQHHVGEDIAPRQQQRVLEHDADIAVRLRDLLALDQDLAGRRRQQPGDHFQQRGLAAAGRTDHDKELALVDMKIQRPQRRHVAVARTIGFGDAGQLNARACRRRDRTPGADARRADRYRLVWSPDSFSRVPRHPSSSNAGPIRRVLSFGHGAADLLQQFRPVVMGPCARRDDDGASSVAHEPPFGR